MKQKKFIHISIFSLLLIANAFLFFNNFALENFYNKEITKCKKENKRHYDAFLQEMDMLSQGFHIDLFLINDIIIKKRTPVLIFAFTKDECDKCIVADIALLKNEMSIIGGKNVIVLPVFENLRNNNITLKANLDGLIFKRLDLGSINFPQRKDGSSTRFFAVITTQNKLILPFFPSSENPERTKMYLNYVFNKIL